MVTATSHDSEQICGILHRPGKSTDDILTGGDRNSPIVANKSTGGLQADDTVELGWLDYASERLVRSQWWPTLA